MCAEAGDRRWLLVGRPGPPPLPLPPLPHPPARRDPPPATRQQLLVPAVAHSQGTAGPLRPCLLTVSLLKVYRFKTTETGNDPYTDTYTQNTA